MHLYLAHEYTGVVVGSGRFNGNGVSQGFLFYVVGLSMLALAVALQRGSPRTQARVWSVGGWLMTLALLALLVYRLGSPGEIGPIPDMSNSTWGPIGKPISGFADLAFVILAAIRRPIQRRRDREEW